MQAVPLTPAARQALKARAHALAPVVLVGAGGLTPAVFAEIDRALAAHELIKIRVAGEDRTARERLLARICERSGSVPVQHIGKILVVYRERVEPPPASAAPPRPAARKPPAVARDRGTRPGAGARAARPPAQRPRRARVRPR
ncbi:MAG: YhbY family RNA-binding protein [Burkholderiales bacterium]|nr:YhbY family RNA-binding protein [Burkholderiales bacterium]